MAAIGWDFHCRSCGGEMTEELTRLSCCDARIHFDCASKINTCPVCERVFTATVRESMSDLDRRVEKLSSLSRQNFWQEAIERGWLDLIADSTCKIPHMLRNGVTPLYHACDCQQLEVARWLLEQGVDPNSKNDDKRSTPMEAAVNRGSANLVRLLVYYGGSPHWSCQVESSPLQVAIGSRQAEVACCIIGLGVRCEEEDLEEATLMGLPAVVADLIGAGVSPVRKGRSPSLQAAAAQGSPETLSLLLGTAAAECANQETLKRAIQSGSLAAVRLVVEQFCVPLDKIEECRAEWLRNSWKGDKERGEIVEYLQRVIEARNRRIGDEQTGPYIDAIERKDLAAVEQYVRDSEFVKSALQLRILRRAEALGNRPIIDYLRKVVIQYNGWDNQDKFLAAIISGAPLEEVRREIDQARPIYQGNKGNRFTPVQIARVFASPEVVAFLESYWRLLGFDSVIAPPLSRQPYQQGGCLGSAPRGTSVLF